MSVVPENAEDIVRDQRFYLPVLASVVSLSGISLLAPALPAIAGGLSLPDQQVGLLITSFTLPAVVILPFAGFLADRFGRNRVLGAGCVILGAAGFLTAFVDGLAMVLLLRAVQGGGYALVMPVTVAVLGDVYSAEQETAAQGLRTSINKVGKMGWLVLGGADALLSPLHKSLLTRNVDPEHRAGIVAANSIGQNLGKTTAPVVMGLFLVAGFTPLFIAAGVAAVLSGGGYFLLRHQLLARTAAWNHPAEL
ncbi:MAG: MFS transporter [Candidatus Nanohaloarchaea archaeon]|nr:MFS transporter [Candidatus Nanohaloarchaea archaeon]